MKLVSDLPAKALVDYMESIHTNGPVGGPLTVDNLSSYLIFVYAISQLLQQVDYDAMRLDMETIHNCAVKCGALKEKPTDSPDSQEALHAHLYNGHMGVFFQRLASYVGNQMKKLNG